jgi:hypothetical protein
MKASEITFGLEIECYLPNSVRELISVGQYHRGDQIEGWPAGWNAQHDGSLHAPAGYFGVEIVSPILKGEDGLIQAAQAVLRLQDMHAISDRSCGIHVHIGAGNITSEQFTRIVKAFKRYEFAFWSLNGSQMSTRLQSFFCKPASMWQRDRYNSLNTTNYGRSGKNTIECRLFASVIDCDFVLSAIYMITALVARITETEINPRSTQLPADVAVDRFIHDHFQVSLASAFCIVEDESPAEVAAFMLQQLTAAAPQSPIQPAA